MSAVLSQGPAGAELDLQSKLQEVVSKELNELSGTIAAALSLELAPYFERLNLEKDSLAAELRRLSEVGGTSRSTAEPSPAQTAGERPAVDGRRTLHLQGSEAEGLEFAQDEAARVQQFERNKVLRHGLTSEWAEESTATGANEVEDRYESLYDLTRLFHTLCSEGEASITVGELIDMLDRQGFVPPEVGGFSVDTRETRLTDTIKALNHELGIMPTHESPKRDEEVCLDTFIAVMQARDEFYQGLDSEVLKSATEIRDILIQEDAAKTINKFTNTTCHDLSAASQRELTRKVTVMDRVLVLLDPVIGVVILLNALCISISTDVSPDADAWWWLEATFTLIFIAEFLIKLVAQGPCEFILGADFAWNWFDTVIVLIATIDLVFTLLGNLVSLRNLTIVRLLRFLRLTRLVRVLRLKMFKELSLMVSGLLAGMRVLIWAMIFLGFILFSLGVLTTRTVGQTTHAYWASACDHVVTGTESAKACESSAEHLKIVHTELFGNVFRSTFTIFRCFMGDCSSADGTPLIPLFYNTHGIFVVIGYMVLSLFVNFGLFNLIMAIFVENTLDNAKRVTATRRDAKYKEDVHTALRLQRLVVAFCGGKLQNKDEQQGQSRWKMFAAWVRGQPIPEEGPHENFGTSLSTKVTQDAFNKALKRKEVQAILEDLDIDPVSRHGIFEIIDGNSNGSVGVEELVQGILKLRGSEAKGDAVACLLAVRSVQKSIKALEVLGMHHQQAIQRIEVEQQGLCQLKALPRKAFEPEGAAASGDAADAMNLPQEVQAALAERGLPPSAARLKRVTPVEEVWTIDVPSP